MATISSYIFESTLVDLLFRLQEAILTIPRGITRLMDMLMDREVLYYNLVYAPCKLSKVINLIFRDIAIMPIYRTLLLYKQLSLVLAQKKLIVSCAATIMV